MLNWKYLAYHTMWEVLDGIFPPVCGGCRTPGSRWCVDCQGRVQVLDGVVCDVCGLPQKDPGICELCQLDRPHFNKLRAWAEFSDPVRSALHKLKYYKDLSLGESFASQMLPFVQSLGWNSEVLIPIPLGRQRLRERGYNQVGMIAKPLALALGIRYKPNGLTRFRETRSQVGLTRLERKQNVENAFLAAKDLRGKSILIMDDVSTTGATLSAATQVLYAIGAKEVNALTVARALPHHGLKQA